jgi:hypothetical protein
VGESVRTFLLQDWVTLRGTNGSVTTFTQDEERWLDLAGFSDTSCWIDVMEVTPPANTNTNYLTLALETAAVCDDSYFTAMAPPVSLGTAAPFNQPSTTPIVVRSTRAVSASALMRYLRWKITPSTSGLWDLTFRIRAVATRSSAFVPTDIVGCLLWLRADLGITFNGAAVSGWADQSGNGNNASQSTVASQPTFSQTAMNGLPAIQGGGAVTPLFMTTPAFTIGSNATIAVAAQPTTTPQTGFARLVEQRNDTAYYLGVNSAGAYYKFIVNDNTSPYGTAEGSAGLGGAVATANTIVTGTYASATTTGTLYVNGKSIASDSTNFPAPGAGAIALTIMQRYTTPPSQPWLGYLGEIVIYNRALSPGELTRLHRYLGARYNVAVP